MMGETSYYRRDAVYCRKQAARGLFGQFVLGEGQYLHDIDSPACSLREVAKHRWGQDWDMSKSGGVPMHYPTHSIGGLLSVMKTHLTAVSAFGYVHPGDDWFRPDTESGNLFSNETALFRCANGAAVRICEYRRTADSDEGFELHGTAGTFRSGPGGEYWVTLADGWQQIDLRKMRDPLPPEVEAAYRRGVGHASEGASEEGEAGVYGGHGGSHAYLVHEFVDAIATGRRPAIHAWEAVRYCVPGIIAHKSALKGGELLKIPDWGDPPA
jgi:hypothetical protein